MPAERALATSRSAPPTAVHPAGRHRESGDDGFSLIEVLVAIAVIGTVMTAVAPFLVQSLVLVGQQRSQQAAIQVANDGLERARALSASSLVAGRGKAQTQLQWDAAPTVVAGYLADMEQVWDPMLPDSSDAGIRAPLPTAPNTVSLDGATYDQSWYVGRCWQHKADPGAAPVQVGDCGPDNVTNDGLPFYRVVVAVTWGPKLCDGLPCVYLASTLLSIGADPRFDLNRPPPTITDPGAQTGYVTVPVDLQLFSTGGRLPVTWTATGLPLGLAISNQGKITGTPTATGTYHVKLIATDRDGRADDAVFTWVIADLPTLTTPGAQTSRTGTAVSLSVIEAGGVLPLTWSAIGLPAGLSIDPATGVLSGIPTTVQTLTATVTVVDRGNRTASVPFTWDVLTPVQLQQSDPQSVPFGVYNGDFAPSATGGVAPYTWTAANLPGALAMDPATGALSGTVSGGTRFISTVTVTDSVGGAGGSASMSVVFTVTGGQSSDPQVTVPSPANPDQATDVGTPVSLSADVSGGVSEYAWTAAGLPPGLEIDASTGAVTGTPTTVGTYVVTLTVTDGAGKMAKLMFAWKVT